MKDMNAKLVLHGDSSRMNAALTKSERHLQLFGSRANHVFGKIKSSALSLQGKLAGLGISVGASMLMKQSAQLDQTLIRIGQTADMSRINIMGLRKELFRMSKETGQSIEDLSKGFNTAVQAGLSFKQAVPVLDAVNKAMAVTGAPGEGLTNSLTVAGSIFDFDLSKPGQALLLLDKMRVAGKKGRYEMEQLSSIFPVVGFTAKRAGMNFDQTLGFIEALSQAEPNVERGGTLAKSWLRLFTNQPYMLKAQKATGVKFFDAKGSRRDAMTVFADIKKQHDKLKTDSQKHSFISSFLEGADTETITASVALLGKEYLENANVFTKEIREAGGTLNKELPDAINNAVDQTGRLKAALREAADAFIIPFNDGITAGIKKLLDSKENGGLNMSGKKIIAGGAIASSIAYLGYNLTGGPLKKLLGRLGNTGAGIGEGLAIKYATGVTPVYVVNMPPAGLAPGMPGDKGKPGPLGGGGKYLPFASPLLLTAPLYAATLIAAATSATAVGSAGRAMRGEDPNNWINEGWMEIRKGFYGDMLYDYMHPEVKSDVNLNVTVYPEGRVITKSSDPNTRLNVNLNRGTWDNPLGVR